jgi:small subunit ribosomal protein S6
MQPTQRVYEVMFIVRPDVADEDLDKLISTLEGHATHAGAKIKNTERMGKRRLAYVVRGFADGNYILMTLEADGAAIHEVERRLRVSEPVIKFITVRVDESQKRVDKLAKLRAGKVKRSATEAAQAQQTPVTPATVETSAAEAAPEAPASV